MTVDILSVDFSEVEGQIFKGVGFLFELVIELAEESFIEFNDEATDAVNDEDVGDSELLGGVKEVVGVIKDDTGRHNVFFGAISLPSCDVTCCMGAHFDEVDCTKFTILPFPDEIGASKAEIFKAAGATDVKGRRVTTLMLFNCWRDIA